MRIHLIRSEEISIFRFSMIYGILKGIKGPIEFVVQEKDITEEDNEVENVFKPQVLRWDTLFGVCEKFRERNSIPDDEFVCYLTDHMNELNWFSAWENSGRKNFFVQTSRWDNIVESDSSFPIIYELASIPLYALTCKDHNEVERRAHKTPRGCPFDYCRTKSEVLLKLRTGDVCGECRDIMELKNVEPAIAKQIFRIYDETRSQILFRERSRVIKELSPLEIDTFHRKLNFPGFLDNSLTLPAQEFAVYLFFLRYPEGLSFRQVPGYKKDLTDIYRDHCGADEDVIISRVNNIVTNRKDVLSQLIYKINEKIANIVPPGLKDFYQITGKKSEKRVIRLDRELATYVKL